MGLHVPNKLLTNPDLYEPGRKPVGEIKFIPDGSRVAGVLTSQRPQEDRTGPPIAYDGNTFFDSARGIKSSATVGDGAEFAVYANPTYPFTVVARFLLDSNTATHTIATTSSTGFQSSDDGYYGVQLYSRSSSPYLAIRIGDGVAFGGGATNRRNCYFDAGVMTGEKKTVVIRCPSNDNTAWTAYVNGIKYAANSPGGTYTGEPIGSTVRGLMIAGGFRGGIESFDGSVEFYELLDRDMSDAEARLISLDPYGQRTQSILGGL